MLQNPYIGHNLNAKPLILPIIVLGHFLILTFIYIFTFYTLRKNNNCHKVKSLKYAGKKYNPQKLCYFYRRFHVLSSVCSPPKNYCDNILSGKKYIYFLRL